MSGPKSCTNERLLFQEVSGSGCRPLLLQYLHLSNCITNVSFTDVFVSQTHLVTVVCFRSAGIIQRSGEGGQRLSSKETKLRTKRTTREEEEGIKDGGHTFLVSRSVLVLITQQNIEPTETSDFHHGLHRLNLISLCPLLLWWF